MPAPGTTAPAENALPPRESLSELDAKPFSHRAIKRSAPRSRPSLCNSSLNKLQSKLTNRHLRACHNTQLWEKVPGQPYHVRIAERRRHRSISRLTLCATSIPLRSRPAACTLTWKLFASVLLVERPVRQGCLERGDEDMSLHSWPRGSC
jgi:hypothetical protein